MDVMLIILALGVILGYYLGRSRAERLRAKSDMRKAWDSRQSHRNGPFHGWPF